MKAPFPYFGGKSRVAAEVWSRFGTVQNYVEPFFGSGAVMLGRPAPFTVETVNDKDCYLANFWRACQADPAALARLCDWPINEADLEARHLWLVTEGATRLKRCKADPTYYDLQVAAWWVWGQSQWIGYGWCKGFKSSIWKKAPKSDSRSGVHQKKFVQPWKVKPHLSSHSGIWRKRPRLSGWGQAGVGAVSNLQQYFLDIQARFRLVRVCCGDWKRVTTKSSTALIGITAVFLDPPYGPAAGRQKILYSTDDEKVAAEAAAWAFAAAKNPKMRIALCGYEGEHKVPSDWKTFSWKAAGGYSNQPGHQSRGKTNRLRERIWFSPNCLEPQPELF